MSGYKVDIRKEEFEVVTVFDYPMLFTCLRCDRDTLPEGMYLYEVRHDDAMQGIPCEIAERILVNHWGTVISNKPLELTQQLPSGKKYRLINEETDWNYEDIHCSLREYMQKYSPQNARDPVAYSICDLGIEPDINPEPAEAFELDSY